MVNRENWKFVKQYLAYLGEVKQLDDGTIQCVRSHLHHILAWADATPFVKAPDIRPTFSRYISERLSPGSVELSCGNARRFFEWLRLANRRVGKSVTELWCKSLVKPRAGSEVKQYNEYTLEEVSAMIAPKSETLRMARDQAAVAFLFLSGMRIGAFATLPIKSIDLGNLTVRQWPELGVHTKLGKKATTFLLDIPDVLEIVFAWDKLVRSSLPDDALWYATIDKSGEWFAGGKSGNKKRDTKFPDGLQRLCDLAGVTYRSPHNLRHGFAVYGLKNAKDIADMEAVSKNLMHKSLKITLEVYAVLREGDVKARIVGLGNVDRIARTHID